MADEEEKPGAIALSIAAAMQHLGNGEMAALRRLDDPARAPAFWRLAARHDALARRADRWGPVVRALALLTPKGQPGERGDIRDDERKLGAVLCDGGQRDWPSGGDPRPMLSELRLAQLLAARGEQRPVLLMRAVRMLAARRDPGKCIDVPDLAWAFLNDDPHGIARPYYIRLDRAERAAATDEETATDA